MRNFPFKAVKQIWPMVGRLSFVFVSLAWRQKTAKISHNSTLSSCILGNIFKACRPKSVHFVKYPEEKQNTSQHFCQYSNSAHSAVAQKVWEFSSVFALRWNTVWGLWSFASHRRTKNACPCHWHQEKALIVFCTSESDAHACWLSHRLGVWSCIRRPTSFRLWQ